MAWPQTRKRKIILIIILASVLLSTASLILWKKVNDGPSLPKSISNQVEFTAFLPKYLPAGYSIDQSSYTLNGGALIVKINTPKDTVILLSQQPEPGNFDISEFHDKLKDRQAVETPYGTAYIGKAENTKVGSLVTSGSWIFASSSLSLDSEIMKSVLRHLSKVN